MVIDPDSGMVIDPDFGIVNDLDFGMNISHQIDYTILACHATLSPCAVDAETLTCSDQFTLLTSDHARNDVPIFAVYEMLCDPCNEKRPNGP